MSRESCAARSGEGLGVKWSLPLCIGRPAGSRVGKCKVQYLPSLCTMPASMLFGVDWVLGTVLPSVALFLSFAAPTDEASRMLLSFIAS